MPPTPAVDETKLFYGAGMLYIGTGADQKTYLCKGDVELRLNYTVELFKAGWPQQPLAAFIKEAHKAISVGDISEIDFTVLEALYTASGVNKALSKTTVRFEGFTGLTFELSNAIPTSPLNVKAREEGYATLSLEFMSMDALW